MHVCVCVCQTSRFGGVAHDFGPYLQAHIVLGDHHYYFASINSLSYIGRFQWWNTLPTVYFMSM